MPFFSGSVADKHEIKKTFESLQLFFVFGLTCLALIFKCTFRKLVSDLKINKIIESDIYDALRFKG